MSITAEKVTESFSLGEAPHWDPKSQSLYFVDCIGQSILKYNPDTKKVSKASTAPKTASFIIPVENEQDHFIISLDKDLVIIEWNGQDNKYSVIDNLCAVDNLPESSDNKFNDGKCDSSGRLWAGTFKINRKDPKETLPLGSLYSFDEKNKLKHHLSQIRISNGLAFNEKANKMFYIDTLNKSIDRFDFDIVSGTISNRQVWYTLEKPDGMTIDSNGNLWVAMFGSSQVIKIDGYKPQTLLTRVELPAKQVTSVAFGGPNLDELYVTSATFVVDGEKPPPPANGAVYKVTGIGAQGLPAANFKYTSFKSAL